MGDELLIVKKERDKMKFKVVNKETNRWSPSKYEKVIANKDYNLLAFLLFDLYQMGYDVERAFSKFKTFVRDPELFFLR